MSSVMVAGVPAGSKANRLQVDRGNAGRDIQASLALHADWLQAVGIAGTT